MPGRIRKLFDRKIDARTWSELELWNIGRGDIGEDDPRNTTGKQPRMIWIHQGDGENRKIGTAVVSTSSGIRYDKLSLKRCIGLECWVGKPDTADPDSKTLYIKELSPKALSALDGLSPMEQADNEALFTDPANLTKMRVEVTGTKEVRITEGTYTRPSNGNTYMFNEARSGFGTGNDSIATLIAALTSGQHQVAWICVARETGKIKVVASTAASAAGTLPQRSQLISTIFTISVTSTYKRLVPVYLYYGQALVEGIDLYRQFDARLDSTAGASGGGGIGNVTGPGSSTDRAIATWNGTAGTTLRNNANATIDASGNLTAASLISNGSITQIIATKSVIISHSATDTRNISWPDLSGTVAILTGAQTFQNKTLDNTNTVTLKDTLFTLQDNSDTTKQAVFELSGIATATTRTLTVPNASGTIALINSAGQGYVMTSPIATSDNTIAAGSGIVGLTVNKTAGTDNIQQWQIAGVNTTYIDSNGQLFIPTGSTGGIGFNALSSVFQFVQVGVGATANLTYGRRVSGTALSTLTIKAAANDDIIFIGSDKKITLQTSTSLGATLGILGISSTTVGILFKTSSGQSVDTVQILNSSSAVRYAIGAETIASGASAVLRNFYAAAQTITITGSTNITTATGFNLVEFGQPTYSAASALTITNAATLYIANSPAGGGAGPATITNAYSLWVDAGASRFDGNIDLSNAAVNVILQTATGTQWGTATGQKQAWWGATPVVQQVLATGAGATVDNVISLLQTLGLCKQS